MCIILLSIKWNYYDKALNFNLKPKVQIYYTYDTIVPTYADLCIVLGVKNGNGNENGEWKLTILIIDEDYSFHIYGLRYGSKQSPPDCNVFSS